MKKRHNDELKIDKKSCREKATTPLEMHASQTQLREITDRELSSLAVRARVEKAPGSVLHTFSVESEGDIVKTTFVKSMKTINIESVSQIL